jgi:HEAT repeat protein
MTPEGVVQMLHGLELTLLSGGGATFHFERKIRGGAIRAVYQPEAPLHQRLRLEAVLTGAPQNFRVVARRHLPGFEGRVLTGDAAFDAVCSVYTESPFLLACLRAPMRARVQQLIVAGGWLADGSLGLPAVVLADLTPSEAVDAGQQLEAMAGRLYDLNAHEALTRCAHDEAEGVRAAAAVWVRQRVRDGRLPVNTLVEALQHHPPADPLGWLLGLKPPADQSAAWLEGLEVFAGAEGTPQLDQTLVKIARRGPKDQAHSARTLVVRHALARLTRDPEAQVAAVFHGARKDDVLLRLLARYAIRDEVTPVVGWFRRLSFDEPQQLEVLCKVLGALGTGADVPWVAQVAQSATGNGQVSLSMAAERALLDLLADGYAMGGEPTATIVRLLRAGGQLAFAIVQATARLSPLPAGTAAALLAGRQSDADEMLAHALIATRDPVATPGLVECLNIESTIIRVLVVEALGAFGSTAALGALQDWTGFFIDGQLRNAAKAAITAIEERNVARGALSLSGVAPGGGLSEVD